MADDLNISDMAAIRGRLGPLNDELHQVMLDVDAAPIFLFSTETPRLVEVRDKAVTALDRWAIEVPDVVAGIFDRLMDVFQTPSVSESLLVAVTWATQSKLSIDLFENPSSDSRVFAAAPNLVPLLDESGLVTVTDLDARPWGLHTGNYAFQYHQLLRRGYSSNIHYELIGTVLRLAKQHDLIARFALDDRRLRYKDEYQEWEEKDFWYGRSLADEDLDNLSAVGETFYGDRDGGTSWLHPYAGLSVRWTADGPLKGVEIEEFMPPPKPGNEWVFARYLHAIRDTETKAFVHCDGAVKAFAGAGYPTSQQGFRTRGKGDRYRKLFRIDGQFPVASWSEVACSWFRGNRLILEYFETAK
ncbi:hypothetical protein [Nocardioides luteus]|uniref:hypothetical protein n=1 Tax=Nocardioides luteus TaxID=1844 RepID=UPI0018CB3AB4|nr:hypothetical protein [Nocardioides luteus]MBG6097144.1 hypothetical protein [Nocardioides luteus]